MKYFFSAGEHSGDMHAATLIRELRKLDPKARIWGMGGPLMAAEGAEILFDPTRESTIGFWEAGRNLLRFKRYLKEFSLFLKEKRPDAVVWVDFGGFNLRLAEAAKEYGIPVVCIFSPSAWAYGKKRAARMAGSVTHLAAIFPFEADFYREFGLKVTFVGHPLLDRVKATVQPEEWRHTYGIEDGETVIVLMPGSRRQEIGNLLPVMVKAAAELVKIRERIRFFLPLAPSIERELIRPYLAGFTGEIKIIDGKETYNLMAAADFGIIASGTSTLEAAIMQLPMVVIYRVSPLSAFIYRRLANKEYKSRPLMIAQPNLIAGRLIVPELVQEDLTPGRLFLTTHKLLKKSERETMKKELIEMRKKLGSPGALRRAAQIILGEAQGK